MATARRLSVLGLSLFLLAACTAEDPVTETSTSGSTSASTSGTGGGGFTGIGGSSGDVGGNFATGGSGPVGPAHGGIVNDGDPDACLARPVDCDASPDEAETYLDQLLGTCADELYGTPPPCGEVEVAFDPNGCAASLWQTFGSEHPELVACLAEHLDADRWPCAASLSVKWFVSCTVL